MASKKHLFQGIFILLLVGCGHTKPLEKAPIAYVQVEPEGTELLSSNQENVRYADKIKGYVVGRYVDGKVMHEGHVVYRVENSACWNRSPNAPTAVPLGATVAVSHPNRNTDLVREEMESSIERQNQLLKALLREYESMKIQQKGQKNDRITGKL